MIKRLIDTLRSREGYAGMAAYREGILLFNESLDPGLADKSRRLFEECEAAFKASHVASVIRGYTITTFRAGGLVTVCRFEGRFAVPALPVEEEAEYTTGQTAAHLMTREEARREAEHILRCLLKGGAS